MALPSAREQAIRARLDEAAARIVGELTKLAPVEQACVLLLTNQMIDLAAGMWGTTLRDSPSSAPTDMVMSCLASLGDAWDAAFEATKWQGMKVAGIRQMLAIDLCTLTIGYVLALETTSTPMTASWRLLWQSRSRVGEALMKLRDWEVAHGADAVPRLLDGRRQTDEEILSSSVRYPAFFRRATTRRT